MYIMNNNIKYVILYTCALASIRVIAFPTSSKVFEPAVNYGITSEENIHTETNEEYNNEEAEINRSKKSTTFCVEIKSGTPECVPCQPVMIGAQPQVVYVTDNHTAADSNIINNTATQRHSEIVLPPEPPCPKDEIFLILPPQQVQPTVSMVQVPVVHQVPQSPQILVATKPFLQSHFPELLNESNVQIQPLMPVDGSLSMADPQFPQLFQPSGNTFTLNQNDNWNVNPHSKEQSHLQGPMLPSPEFKLLEPSENQGINANLEFGAQIRNQPPFQPLEHQNSANGAISQQYPSSIGSLQNRGVGSSLEFGVSQHPSSIGSLQNYGAGASLGFGVSQHPSPIGSLQSHGAGASLEFGVEMQNQPSYLQPSQYQNIGQNFEYGTVQQQQQQQHSPMGMGQNFGFGVEVQQQPSFTLNQQGSTLNRIVQPQHYSSLYMNNHASGQKYADGVAGQLPVREAVNSQRPVSDIQTQQSHYSNMNVVMGQDGLSYYLVPSMINGNPQLCLEPQLINNPSLNNIKQQSSTQHQNISASESQQSSSSINKQSREIKESKATLKSPEVQTTVAPIKSGIKPTPDVKGKGGPSSLLNHLKGPSSLSKARTIGKGQNKDTKGHEKLEGKRGNKRETEI